ncbi:DNA polymerase IV [Paenibacillus sp. sgz500958]|uniref:DNA polymerase Y family protein n=1 Tax=Paenibacillus sp. sgz500958 TaxID=3242475 RepID=UPI0036D2C482
MERIIIHADLNSFYASVECLLNPELKSVPMAVIAGHEENRHGVILAKNELAKKYGVKTAESIRQAKSKCPELLTVLPHHDLYREYSGTVKAIYARYTSQVESFGLDECWMDMTSSSLNQDSVEAFANTLRETVKSETGLTISVGISWNKVFAKLGSDVKKPDATTMISRHNFKEKVWPLPASDLLFVGNATNNILSKHGIYTIGDIATSKLEFLQHILDNTGRKIWTYANGLDTTPVAYITEKEKYKTISNSLTTPKDVMDIKEARDYILFLSEGVAQRLQENNLKCKTVQIILKDTNFRTKSRQGKLSFPTYTATEIAEKAIDLLSHNYSFQVPLRLIGVTASDLTDLSEGEQLTLFDKFP